MEQECSLALPHSVYFSLIKIQYLLVSRTEDLQIQDILSHIVKKARCHRQKHDTSLYPVHEKQQESSVENICVLLAYDEFLNV